MEEEQEWVCTSQLHQLLLYLLIYGEAANLRFLPEALSFIFFCASNALTLEPVTEDEFGASSLHPEQQPQTARNDAENSAKRVLYQLRPVDADSAVSSMPYLQDDFLDTIVSPIYEFLQEEILKKRDLPVDERVMYDDVNEFFWSRSKIEKLLNHPQHGLALGKSAHLAYEALRSTLRAANESDGGPAHELSKLFTKTFKETVSVARVLYVFSRVLILHSAAWHACLVTAFFEELKWRYLCTVTLTHATLKMLVHIYEMLPHNRSNHLTDDASRIVKKGSLWYWGILLMYALSPALFAFDFFVRRDPLLIIFQFYSAVYLALCLGQLLVQHSLLSDSGRKLHGRLSGRKYSQPFLGSAIQLTVPSSWFAYMSFWMLTGGLKLAFGYYGLAQPLIVPLTALWNLDFDGEGTAREPRQMSYVASS